MPGGFSDSCCPRWPAFASERRRFSCDIAQDRRWPLRIAAIFVIPLRWAFMASDSRTQWRVPIWRGGSPLRQHREARRAGDGYLRGDFRRATQRADPVLRRPHDREIRSARPRMARPCRPVAGASWPPAVLPAGGLGTGDVSAALCIAQRAGGAGIRAGHGVSSAWRVRVDLPVRSARPEGGVLDMRAARSRRVQSAWRHRLCYTCDDPMKVRAFAILLAAIALRHRAGGAASSRIVDMSDAPGSAGGQESQVRHLRHGSRTRPARHHVHDAPCTP